MQASSGPHAGSQSASQAPLALQNCSGAQSLLVAHWRQTHGRPLLLAHSPLLGATQRRRGSV
jgi:hypothetical protein